MNAPTLFDAPAARATDPETSHAAAARVAPFRSTLRAQILEALVTARTDEEMCLALGIPVRRWPSAKTARSSLFKDGKVRWTGIERDGMRVWQTVEVRVEVRNGAL